MEEERRCPLSRDEIVHAAVRQMAEAGLEALTLRKLAVALGVRAPTLYWHVRDKRELMDLVADAIMAEVESGLPTAPRHGQAWWDWLTEHGHGMYRALITHRDAVMVLAGNRPTERSLPRIEQFIRSLVVVGFPPAEALQIIFGLGMLVMGSALEHQAEQARREARAGEGPAAGVPSFDDYPYLAAAVTGMRALDQDAAFAMALDRFVAGLQVRHEQLTAALT